MLTQIATITAPVFLLTLAGYVWARRGLPFDIGFVTRLSLGFSVPCLVFAVLVKVEIDRAAFADIALASVAAYLLLAAAFWAILRGIGLDRRAYLAPLVFSNTGNVGLPVALLTYGEPGLALAVVNFAVMAIFSFTWGIWLVAGAGRSWDALRQPLVYAAVLGGVFAWMGWGLPAWILGALDLAGQIAIPLMLLTLGVSIARLRIADLGRAAVISALKLGVCGAVALGVAWGFGLSGAALGTLVLQLVMPVAVTNYMIAERYDADPQAVAGLVVVSTLMSVGVIPLVLALLLASPA